MEDSGGSRRRERLYDPWVRRGWDDPRSTARVAVWRAYLGLAVLAVLLFGFSAGVEIARALAERSEYVAAEGVVVPGPVPQVVLTAPEIGSLRLPAHWVDDDPEPGDRLRALVGRVDPMDVLGEDARAEPVVHAVAFVVVCAVIALLGAALAWTIRRARLDVRGVERAARQVGVVAVRPLSSGPPLGAERPWWRTASILPALPLLLYHGVRIATDRPYMRTATGTVVVATDGSYVVPYYDDVLETTWDRTLTSVEASRVRPGDDFDVRYGDGAYWVSPWPLLVVLVVSAGAAQWLFSRGRRWERALTAIAAEPPCSVEGTAWCRERGNRAWLAVAPVGATRARDVVFVPITRSPSVPDAMTGTLQVSGRLRRGGTVVVYDPEGRAIRPYGPARGALGAALAGVPATPPVPPEDQAPQRGQK